MACNCVRDNERKIAEQAAKRLDLYPDEIKVTAKSVSIVFGKTVVERAYLPYGIKCDKPGYRGANGKEVSMFFTFCPFCGERLEELS